MISRRLAVGIASLTGCLIAASTSGAQSGRRQVAWIDGPGSAVDVSFAGHDVLYSRIDAQRPAVYSVENGLLYEAPEMPLPPQFKKPGLYESRVTQSVSSLVGGPGVIAFVRSVTVFQTPKCRPACGLPSSSTPLFSELRVRFGSGPFRRVAGGPGRCPAGQFWPDEAAVMTEGIVYSGRLGGCKGRRQQSRVGVAASSGGVVSRTVVARFLRTGFVRVAAAGRFIAWSWDWGRSKRPDLHDAELVVYDRSQGRVAYTVEVPRRPRLNGVYSIDVQSDGTVAAQITRDGGSCYIPQLVWSVPSPVPRLRVVPERPEGGWTSDVKLAGNRLMFLRSSQRGCSASFNSSDLVVKPLYSPAALVLGRYGPRGRPRTYPGRSFDFDGGRSLFSEGISSSKNANRTWTAIFVDELS